MVYRQFCCIIWFCIGLRVVSGFSCETGSQCFCNSGACFTFHRRALPWKPASKQCSQREGQLLRVLDDGTSRYVARRMLDLQWKSAWLGGKEVRLSQWFWADEETLSEYSFSYWADISFSGASVAFTGSVPDKISQKHNCVLMSGEHTYHWQHRACGYPLGFICQRISTREECKHHDEDHVQVHYNQSCYSIHFMKLSWFASWRHCRDRDGYLAKVDSASVQRRLSSELNKTEVKVRHFRISGFWIGLRRSRWMWTDGSPVQRFHWEAGEPYNGYRDLCITLRRYSPREGENDNSTSIYRWASENCNEDRCYICEHEQTNTSRLRGLADNSMGDNTGDNYGNVTDFHPGSNSTPMLPVFYPHKAMTASVIIVTLAGACALGLLTVLVAHCCLRRKRKGKLVKLDNTPGRPIPYVSDLYGVDTLRYCDTTLANHPPLSSLMPMRSLYAPSEPRANGSDAMNGAAALMMMNDTQVTSFAEETSSYGGGGDETEFEDDGSKFVTTIMLH